MKSILLIALTWIFFSYGLVTDAQSTENEPIRVVEKPTQQEKNDLWNILIGSRSGNNSLWNPTTNRTNTDKPIRIYVYVADDVEDLKDACGKEALACTAYITKASIARGDKAFIKRIGLKVGDIIVFLPKRFDRRPMEWFYVIGHEFAHVLYGSFHTPPEEDPMADAN